MIQKKAFIVTIIVLFFITLISCSQKFQKPLSNEVGMLVIAHKATNESKQNFPYKYVLKHLPETSVEIKIMPSITSEFIMIDNFPVGKYWISGVTTMGVHSGHSTPLALRKERAINGDSFEIKPNHVTLLNSRFVVLNKMITDSRSRQTWKLEVLDGKSKTVIVNDLKKLENANLWNFPD
jgi:hypothetical protein